MCYEKKPTSFLSHLRLARNSDVRMTWIAIDLCKLSDYSLFFSAYGLAVDRDSVLLAHQ